MVGRFLIFLLTSTLAHAATLRPLDERSVLELSISEEGLTRIKVQGDRILHVFGTSGEYALEVDETQGQVFIRPSKRETVHPISLTLTTEKGHTQELRLIPKNQPPEALILTLNDAAEEKITKEREVSSLSQEEVESLIRACQEGRIPLGYKEKPLRLTKRPQRYVLVRELQGKPLKSETLQSGALASGALRGLTYRVQNTTQKPQILSESHVAQELFVSGDVNEGDSLRKNDLIAILIPKKTLIPGEQTDVYVVARTP